MMHPDQMYQLRHLRHRDLRMEAEQARSAQELAANRRLIENTRQGTTLLTITRRCARYVLSTLATAGFALK